MSSKQIDRHSHHSKDEKSSEKEKVSKDMKNESVRSESDEEQENDLEKFKIAKKTIEILNGQGISSLFPIQASTYKIIYDGLDVVGRDITGSGKTLAYVLPIVERERNLKEIPSQNQKGKTPWMIVLLPTRELSIQVIIYLGYRSYQ